MPQQVHREEELRVHGLADQAEPSLVEGAVALLQVALETRGDDVGPCRLPAPRPRDHVIDRQLLTAPAAVLTRVAVAAEDVLLVERDSLEERLADVDGEPDHGGEVEAARRRPDDPGRGLDALGLAAQQQRDGAFGVGEVQRLVGVVEHQDRDFIHILRKDSDATPALSTLAPHHGPIAPPQRHPGTARRPRTNLALRYLREWMYRTSAQRSFSGRCFQGGMAPRPVEIFQKISPSVSSWTAFEVQSAGFGVSAAAAAPSPLPLAPWQGTQLI